MDIMPLFHHQLLTSDIFLFHCTSVGISLSLNGGRIWDALSSQHSPPKRRVRCKYCTIQSVTFWRDALTMDWGILIICWSKSRHSSSVLKAVGVGGILSLMCHLVTLCKYLRTWALHVLRVR
jgi:hypothetical protein